MGSYTYISIYDIFEGWRNAAGAIQNDNDSTYTQFAHDDVSMSPTGVIYAIQRRTEHYINY